MLKKLYFIFSSLIFCRLIPNCGSGVRFKLQGRVICGRYIHIAKRVSLDSGWTIAVYPTFGGVDNPVKSSPEKGVWIGENCFFNRNLTIYCADSIHIGKEELFGSNILISDNEHGTDINSKTPFQYQPLKTKPVIIGDGCWVAEDVKILSGSEIGERSVIAAGAVVKGKFPPYSIIAGVPAKIIRIWDFEKRQWISPEIVK